MKTKLSDQMLALLSPTSREYVLSVDQREQERQKREERLQELMGKLKDK